MNITLDDGRTELWQWDTGRKIVVDDKSVSEVHYSKYSSTQAITREVIDGKAEIPNFLLQDTHEVTVYAYSGSTENGYTVAEKTFNVVKKPKPANYVETEEDKAILAKLKSAIGDLSELQTEAKDSLVSAINEAAASGGADWSQNDPDGDGYVKNRPGGYMSDPAYNEIFNGNLYGDLTQLPTVFNISVGDTVKVTIDSNEKDYTVIAEDYEGIALRCFGTDTFANFLSSAVTDGFIFLTYTLEGQSQTFEIAAGTYVGKKAVVKALMTTAVVIPKKYLDTDLLDTYVFTVDTDRLTSTASLQDIQNAIDANKIPVAMFNGLYPATISDRGSDITAYLFEAIVNNRILSIWCDHNGWSGFSREEILTENNFSSSLPEPLGIAAAGIRSIPARSDHVHQTELPIVADVETEDCLVLYVERTTNMPSDTDLLTLEGSYTYYDKKSWTGFYTKVTPQYGDPLQVLNNKHPSDFKINARLDTQNTTLSSWDNSRLSYAVGVNASESFGLIIKAVSRDDEYHFAMPMIYVSEADVGKENVEFFTRYSSFSDQQSVTIKKLPDNSGLYLLYKLDNIIYSEKGETKAVAITAPDTAPKKFFVFSPWKSTDILPSSPSFETVIRKEVYPSGGASDFVVNGTIGGETGVGYSITLDKTADQILAAINEGKSVIARVASEITIDLPLVSFDTISGNIIFAGVINYMAMDNISPIIYFLRLHDDEATLYSSVAIALDPEGKMPQVSMASAPTRDMQIATKKYVDDHAGGGTDMGITGATVGQIAKITAVDASGTPTAWEPVDMPSGGGAITYDIAATAERSVQNNTLQGFKCSVSSKQLRKAIDAGKTPRLVIDIRTTIMYMPMTNYFLVGAEYAYVNFGCVDEYGLVSVVCDGESEMDAGKPIWLANSSFVTPTY